MWNPFRKSKEPDEPEAAEEPPEAAEEEEDGDEEELLPPVSGREDTQRVHSTMTELRGVHAQAAAQLKATAAKAARGARATAATLRQSSPAMRVVPPE